MQAAGLNGHEVDVTAGAQHLVGAGVDLACHVDKVTATMMSSVIVAFFDLPAKKFPISIFGPTIAPRQPYTGAFSSKDKLPYSVTPLNGLPPKEHGFN